MALRVTQGMLYSSSISGMNNILTELYKSNLENTTGLRINKPSDDPLGAGRVVMSRATLAKYAVYQDNISTATGWLSSLDKVLSSEGGVQQALTRLKELAEQGANGTYTSENREEMSYELRQIYDQLLVLANSNYGGSYLFSGQQTNNQAYGAALGVTVTDSSGNLDGVKITAEGGADYTVMIQAVDSTISSPAAPGTVMNAEDAVYRYSLDGGDTWIDVNPATDIDLNYPESGSMRINCGGSSIIMPMNAQVTTVDTASTARKDNGTWMFIRPTAEYLGDDHDTQVVIPYGSSATSIDAKGSFSSDVTVRIDSNDGTTVTYSYSLDDGITWVQGTADATGSNIRLAVPGGYLNLDAAAQGEQYVIHPHRAEISLPISDSSSITLNLVGKDVFGGVYLNPATGEYEIVENGGNIFEVLGNLILAAETNDQQGMAEALKGLNDCMNVVLTNVAIVGGRENRLTMTKGHLDTLSFAETDRLSAIEDVDWVELLTRMSNQQTIYSAVLQSSAMIMSQSLLNYL